MWLQWPACNEGLQACISRPERREGAQLQAGPPSEQVGRWPVSWARAIVLVMTMSRWVSEKLYHIGYSNAISCCASPRGAALLSSCGNESEHYRARINKAACGRTMVARGALVAILCLTFAAQQSSVRAQSASTSGATVARSANVTGSLGNQCSSASGILNLLQEAAAGNDTAGLNVTVSTNLTNAAAVQQIASVSN